MEQSHDFFHCLIEINALPGTSFSCCEWILMAGTNFFPMNISNHMEVDPGVETKLEKQRVCVK